MKVLGLILELNPPHYGHKYFIDKAIEKAQPDVTIAIITTNFSMRGDISVINKFDKTSICLDNKIDLVLELPYIGAVASADYFCSNAVNILNKFGITDIAFGCELANITKLRKLNDLLSNPKYNESLKEYLQKGFSYSNACNKALMTMTRDLTLIENFSMPNNTLAIQYISAIDKIKEKTDKEINIHLIQRIENNYYDTIATSNIASATAIRELIANNDDFSNYVINNEVKYLDINSAYDKLLTIIKSTFILKNDIYEIRDLLGVKEGIENRIDNILSSSNLADSYEELVKNACTKRYTTNYIKRLLLNIILKVPDQIQKIDYLRVLGFNKNGEDYIKTLPKNIKSEIITTYKGSLSNEGIYELKATKLYGLLSGDENIYLKEYQMPMRRK